METNRDPGDETNHEPPTASVDSTMYVPIRTSLAVLDVLTESQRWRLTELIRSWKANSATLYRDDFTTSSVLFALYKTGEPTLDGLLLGGLIEPDGRSHT